MLLNKAKNIVRKRGYKIIKEEDMIKESFRNFKHRHMLHECGDSEYYEDNAEAMDFAYTDDEEFGECPVCVICGKECCDDEGEYSEDGDFVCTDCAQNTEQEMIKLDPMSFWDNKIPDSRTPRARQIDDMEEEDDDDYQHFEEKYHDHRHSSRKMYESLNNNMLSEKLPGRTIRNSKNDDYQDDDCNYIPDNTDDEDVYFDPYEEISKAQDDLLLDDYKFIRAIIDIAHCDKDTAEHIFKWALLDESNIKFAERIAEFYQLGSHDVNELAKMMLDRYNQIDPDYDEDAISFIDPDETLDDEIDESYNRKKTKKSKKGGKSNKGWVPYWMYKKNKKDED